MTVPVSNNSEFDAVAPLGRCLVLGGTGFLGHALAEKLVACGASVQVFSRHIPADLEARGVACFQGDIRDKAQVGAAMRGCQTVFHTISCCDIWGRKDKFYSINVDGTANVLECAKQCGVQTLVYTSTPSVVVGDDDIVNGDERLPYASSYSALYPATKRLAEEMVLAANSALRVCALRPHLIWGNRDPHILPNIARAALSGKFRQVGTGENVVSITHISNAVYGHIAAAIGLCGRAVNAGKAYFICDAEPVNLWQWIREYLTLAGLPPIQGTIGRRTAMALAWLCEGTARLFHRETQPRLTRFVVQQLTQSHSFSWRNANHDFGYNPIIGNDAGLAEAIGLSSK
jgi:2-alkyl-3-oxoalkanoate reductase